MPKDKFIKTVLVLILILLCLNLLKSNLASPLLYIKAQAKPGDEGIQIINLTEARGITCSDNGKFVYVIGQFDDTDENALNRECILRSDDWGNPGSWKMVAKQKIKSF